MLRRLLASAALLTFAATFASAEPKHPKPHPKSIARLQADIRRDEAALAAAQRARDPAAIAREQADLARDRAQLQQLQAGVRPRPRPDTSDKHGKKGKKHHHHKKDR